jgi:hypothetical protein
MIYPRRTLKTLLASVALVLGLCACTSDDNAATDNGGGSGAGGAGTGGTATTVDASSGGSMSEAAAPEDQSVVTTTGAGGAKDASSNTMSDAKITDAPAVPVDASKACTDYCTCMAKNCADQVFPQGCLVECSKQTNWDLPCRQNMCNLAPVQTMNDHCTHAFGKFQCTDQ